MNTKFCRSFIMRAPCSTCYTRSGTLHKLPTLFYSLAALACGLFLLAAPARAQYVTPSSYMNDLYIWWKNAATAHYDFQTITVRATFLGGTAHPTPESGIPSMAIFEGNIGG